MVQINTIYQTTNREKHYQDLDQIEKNILPSAKPRRTKLAVIDSIYYKKP